MRSFRVKNENIMESSYNCNHFRLSPEMMAGNGSRSGSAAVGCAPGLSPHSHSQQQHPSASSSTTSSMHKPSAGGVVDIHSEYDLTLAHHHQQQHHHQHHQLSHIQSNSNHQNSLTHHHQSHLNSSDPPGTGILESVEDYSDHKHSISDFNNEGLGETRSLVDIMHHQYNTSQHHQQQQLSGPGGMMTAVDMDDLEQDDLPACAFANLGTQQGAPGNGGRMDLAGGAVSSPPSSSAQGGNHFGVTGTIEFPLLLYFLSILIFHIQSGLASISKLYVRCTSKKNCVNKMDFTLCWGNVEHILKSP